MSFYLTWEQNDTVLKGNQNNIWIDQSLSFPVSHPERYSRAQIITLRSSAKETGTLESLVNVKFYLTGTSTDVKQVQEIWPTFGNVFTPTKEELNGGFEISFDEGRTYTRFTVTAGYESNPATWITLPASAVGLNGIQGKLGPFDNAKMYVRYKIPPQATNFGLLNIQLAADFDII